MRKTMIILAIILVGMLIPVGFSTSDTQVVITYGETTHHNANYKNTVDDFFVKQAGVDLYTIDSKIITAELQKILINSISYYDAQEYFYHAFLTGLLAGIQNLKVESNREYGLGRPDITISELNFNSIAIFEIKHLKIKKKKANARLKNPLIEYIIANETINDSKLLDRSLFFTQESDVNVQKKNF